MRASHTQQAANRTVDGPSLLMTTGEIDASAHALTVAILAGFGSFIAEMPTSRGQISGLSGNGIECGAPASRTSSTSFEVKFYYHREMVVKKTVHEAALDPRDLAVSVERGMPAVLSSRHRRCAAGI